MILCFLEGVAAKADKNIVENGELSELSAVVARKKRLITSLHR